MQVPNKNYKDESSKRLARWLLLIFLWVLIYSVSKGFLQARRGFLRLEEVEIRLDNVKKENNELRSRLEVVSSEEYKTKIVRDQLRLQKSDEVVIVMPDDLNTIRLENGVAEKQNWQKWLELMI